MEHAGGGPAQLLGPEAVVLRLLGLWRPQHSGGGWRANLLAALTLAAVASVPAGATLRLCGDFPEELNELALCSFILIIATGSVIKAALFIGGGENLRELVRLLNATRRLYRRDKSSDRIRNRYKRTVDRLYRYFQVTNVPPVMFWIITPLLSRGVLTEDQQIQRQLPLPLWLPVDIYSSPMYELLYVTQAFCLATLSELVICLDVFFVRLMMLVAAETEVLNESISEIHNFDATNTALGDHMCGVTTIERQTMVNGSGQLPPAADKSSENVSDEMFITLVNNILHHQTILRVVSLLQTAMNVSTFILLVTNMANLCSTMFVTAGLLQKDGNVAKAMQGLLTVPPVLFQTGIYCIFGQITTDQSEKLSDSVYGCGWINCNSHFKRSLLIFMMMVGKPIKITVGKTCPLSKEMLLQVLNGSYVLLNMFLQIRGND